MFGHRVQKRFSVLGAALLPLSVCALMANPCLAVETNKGLTISPLRRELVIEPGMAVDGKLTVTNSTTGTTTVNMSAEEFKVVNQQYDYDFDASSSVAKWVRFGTGKLTLKPGESKTVRYTVGVPLAAEPGGKYIGLFAGSDTKAVDASAGISLRQRVASLLYITVPSDVLGDTTQIGKLLSLSSPWFVVTQGRWSASLQNTGKTHYRSNYNVKVESLFGGVVASGDGSALIMPATVRPLSGTIPLPTSPGIYKVIYTIGLSDSASSVQTRYLLYLPHWAMLVGAIIVAIIAGGVVYIMRRRR